MNFPHLANVDGWLRPNALNFTKYYVDNYADKEFDSLEIGVHHGKYFLAIENMTPTNSRCIAADVFEMQHLNTDNSGKGNREIFESNVKKWALAPQRVITLQVDSMDIDPNVLGINQFGIISIDGGHTREHTFNDLKTAQDLLKPNGLIILDDILNQDWCGVITGALDFFNSPYATRIAPIAIGFNKLFITNYSLAAKRKNQIRKDRKSLSLVGIKTKKITTFGTHNIISLTQKKQISFN